jgi:hypothetical protein
MRAAANRFPVDGGQPVDGAGRHGVAITWQYPGGQRP